VLPSSDDGIRKTSGITGVSRVRSSFTFATLPSWARCGHYTSRALLTHTRLMSPDNHKAPVVTLESMAHGARQIIKVA
jgi:hypothetical protein